MKGREISLWREGLSNERMLGKSSLVVDVLVCFLLCRKYVYYKNKKREEERRRRTINPTQQQTCSAHEK